jgi:hypothetical protein
MPARLEPVSMLITAPASMRQANTTDSALWAGANRAMTGSAKCCVPGCGNPKAADFPLHTRDGPCADHLSLASPQARRLLSSAASRLARLERSWNDEKIFEAIVGRGRYLAFCSLLERANNQVDRGSVRKSLPRQAMATLLPPASPRRTSRSIVRATAGPRSIATPGPSRLRRSDAAHLSTRQA